MNNIISKNELYIAYKKAKYELFHDEKSLCLEELYFYENNLEENINNLYSHIKNNLLNDIELGTFIEIPKSLEIKNKSKNHFSSNSIYFHQNILSSSIGKIEMRKLLLGTIDFHILSALWINLIGQHIDNKFSKNIYGSRLQSINENSFCNNKHKYNLHSSKIFKSYQSNFQRWRNNAFKVIEDNHSHSSIVVMTMDISSFFNSINLYEFTTPEFYNRFELQKLDSWDTSLNSFHEVFISFIKRYNAENSMQGLPIGLTASHILANASLKQFDDDIEKSFNPLYYGRYIDDILLVFNECGSINSSSDIIKFLRFKISSITCNMRNKDFEIVYTAQSQQLVFKQEKQKIFYFDKASDLTMLDAIKHEIYSVSSEWILVPNLLDDNSTLLKKIIGIKSDESEFDDSFRKIESVTIKRLGLALLISHANMINNYLEPKTWENKRFEIYNIIENHIFIPINFIEHTIFLIRTFKLMISSSDGTKSVCFLQKINNMLSILDKSETKLDYFKAYLSKSLYEALVITLNINNKINDDTVKHILEEITKIEDNIDYVSSKEDIVNKNNLMFFKDLTYKSYTNEISKYILDKEANSLVNKLIKKSKNEEEYSWINSKKILEEMIFTTELSDNWNYTKIKEFNHKLIQSCDKKMNIFENNSFYDLSSLLFPTRPFTSLDLSHIIKPTDDTFNDILTMLRGITSKFDLTIDTNEKLKTKTINIKYKQANKNPKIAIANIKLSDKYFYASIKNQPIKSIERFREISKVINDAIKKDIDYLVLPELAIPRQWAVLFAQRLLTKNISFITGVEYLHEDNQLRNSIYHFLISDDIGFNHLKLFRQDKSVPAHGERESIKKLVGKELLANDKYKEKYIYNHGYFYFSSLICNEFTDIENRYRLRGNIDALFIVEWNTDIKYFNALVESVSFDIHCYTIQVNNGKYGDSRIRVPFKEEYDRDLVKIKGGIYNHMVVAEINIDKLREFQSNFISVSKDFKPVPTGYKISNVRKKY